MKFYEDRKKKKHMDVINTIDVLKYYISCDHTSMGINQIQRNMLPTTNDICTSIIPFGFVCTFHIPGFRTFLFQTRTTCWYVNCHGTKVLVENLPVCILPNTTSIHVFEIIVQHHNNDKTKTQCCSPHIWILDTLVFNDKDITRYSIHLRYIYLQNILKKCNNDAIFVNTTLFPISQYQLFQDDLPYRTKNIQFRTLYDVSHMENIHKHCNDGVCFFALYTPFQHKPTPQLGPFLRSSNYKLHLICSPLNTSSSDVPVNNYIPDLFRTMCTTDKTMLCCESGNEHIPVSTIPFTVDDGVVISVVWENVLKKWSVVSNADHDTSLICDSIEYVHHVCCAILDLS
jgi:hypothetical protein